METGLSITPSFRKDDRATAWSITYWPEHALDFDLAKQEIEDYIKRDLPPGWKLSGQMELSPDTKRYHLQGLLKTPQERFSKIKKHMGTAHIEKARNVAALTQYVQKADTRAAALAAAKHVPTIFEYQTIISGMWKQEEFNELWMEECNRADLRSASPRDPDEVALSYIDSLVARDIENGRRGAEWISINPMWRASWRKFWRSIIKRDGQVKASPPAQADEASSPQGAGVE